MLVLSRGVNETIFIGENIKVMIVSVRRQGGVPKVRIGIEAPPDVTVHREEIFNAIKRGQPQKAK